MSNYQKILFFGFILAIAGLVYVESIKPHPINWYPSYSSKDKIPLGTYVLKELAEKVLKDNFKETNLPPYLFIKTDSLLSGNYVFINNNFAIEKVELKEMMQWASKGNQVFLAANYFSENLLDTLQLEVSQGYLMNSIDTKPLLELSNPKFTKKEPYLIDRNLEVTYFSSIDTLRYKVLGVSQVFNDTLKITKPQINFLQIPVGKGNFYLHSQPEVFSNYFLLEKNNANYTQNALSYINNGNSVFWDAYYKTGKEINTSPLYILLNNRYLKWAYYMVLIGVLLYVLFEGKRKQRKIPIIKAPINKTYEYTQTIAGMYLDKKDYKGIAHKQILLFLEYIRTQLRVPTETINTSFFNKVTARSGNEMEETISLFNYLDTVQKKHKLTKEELIKLYTLIKEFKK